MRKLGIAIALLAALAAAGPARAQGLPEEDPYEMFDLFTEDAAPARVKRVPVSRPSSVVRKAKLARGAGKASARISKKRAPAARRGIARLRRR